jgi:hypothetical protein
MMGEETEAIARRIATDIQVRRNGLLRDEDQRRDRGPRTGYARSRTDAKKEEYIIQGMVIALSRAIGHPYNLPKTEAFIRETIERQ